MTIWEAIQARHSVRSYEARPLEESAVCALNEEIARCNREDGLNIQLITDDPNVFQGLMAHYGGFHGVSNYIALVGPSGDAGEERLGFCGERLALEAQRLGLNTCWVAVTYKKRKCRAVVGDGHQLSCVLAVGYGTTQGTPHRSKAAEELCQTDRKPPEWFQTGMEAAMLAPTAMNKQNFRIHLEGDNVRFERKKGPYGGVNLGIVKYHFQVGAGL